ncbi:MAG TPA: hypothetical protein VFN26_11715 [Candidatus Acidoferrum sp.]|nr:hypothetical protein [Candidatus Acidoferrum sp.]
MNRKIFTYLMLSGALLLGAAGLRAQEGPVTVAPPPEHLAMLQEGPGDVMFAGPVDGPVELLGFGGMHGGKVVTGAPFSAVAVSETTQTLADGNHIARTTKTNLFRDSQGRFRKEVTLPVIGMLATAGGPKSFVMIDDPVANTHYILHPEDKTADKMTHSVAGMKGPMRDAIKGKFETHLQEGIANGSLKKEDLGTQTIAGVSVQGTRITHTIPTGQIGNEKPITIVSEHWYSNDLQMMVMSKRSDPRFGDTTYTLTNVQRSEPSAELFTVPSDYTVNEGGVGHHVIMNYKQGPPPPPNE